MTRMDLTPRAVTAARPLTVTADTPRDKLIAGVATPWGPAQEITLFPEQITYVSAVRGGGFFVPRPQLDLIRRDWRLARRGQEAQEDCPWFGEDRDWIFVALSFPGALPPKAGLEAVRLYDIHFAKTLGAPKP